MKYDVHVQTCCVRHGCKYNHKDCPVVTDYFVNQAKLCEHCEYEGFTSVEDVAIVSFKNTD